MSFVEIAKVDQVPPGSMKAFPVGSKRVLIANVDGRFHALDNACPHAGGDLSRGTLRGKVVTCPRHGFRFDVTTGERVSGSRTASRRGQRGRTYEVRVEGNSIQVGVG